MKTRKDIEGYGRFVICDYRKASLCSPCVGPNEALSDVAEFKSSRYIFRYEDCDKGELIIDGVYLESATYPKDGAHPYYEKGEDGVWKLSEYYKELFDKEENK